MPQADPPRAAFVEVGGRQLFTLHYRPRETRGPRVALLPAMAEEMNKTRRLVALIGEALRARHCEFVVADARGTGDSEGHFEDATLDGWANDFATVFGQLLGSVDVIVCLRAGALLAGGVADRLQQASLRAVALQPVLRGAAYLQQLMRVRLMADKLAGGSESADELRALWSRGEVVELSGYAIAPSFASGMQAAQADFAAYDDLAVIECRAADKTMPSSAMNSFIEQFAAGGKPAAGRVVAAEAFWTSQEITAPPAVVEAVVDRCAGSGGVD